jgi:hypothetical protein
MTPKHASSMQVPLWQHGSGATGQPHDCGGIAPEPSGVLETSAQYCAAPLVLIVANLQRHIDEQ